MANIVTGSFSATGQSDALQFRGQFNVKLDFTTGSGVGTVYLKRKLPGESTFSTVTDAQGNPAYWTADVNTVWLEAEEGSAYYEFDCTAYTSGDIAYRLSK